MFTDAALWTTALANAPDANTSAFHRLLAKSNRRIWPFNDIRERPLIERTTGSNGSIAPVPSAAGNGCNPSDAVVQSASANGN